MDNKKCIKMRHIKHIENMRHRFVAFTIIALFAIDIILAPVSAQVIDDTKLDEPHLDEDYDMESESEKPTIVKPLAVDSNGNELEYVPPKYDASKFHFVDTFDDLVASQKRWIISQAKKDDLAEDIAKYDGEWKWELPQRIIWNGDLGLVLKSRAKHAAIAARLFKAFTFKENRPLVVQYEVTLQNGQPCGGAYIKLLSNHKSTEDLTKFNDKTPYTIMFGPDKCGHDIKMHFIFRHVNPINGSISEKHCRKPKDRLEEPFKDRLPHLYQLVVKPDNTFEIRVDHVVINSGSLLTDFTPEVNPPREIDDPNDKKPDYWDDREKIPDPTAVKPDDWDEDAPPQIPDPYAVMPEGWLENEPEMIPDPGAKKPADWDAEIDGEWEAPLIDNPKCEKAPGCGKWKPPLIQNKKFKGKWRGPLLENPNYSGKWTPRRILNPDYFEDLTPFQMTPVVAIGIEIWSIASDVLFDNLIITDNVKVANEFAAQTFDIKRKYVQKESKTLWHRFMRYINYRPGLWALYLLYLAIPAGCYIYYLYCRATEESIFTKIMTPIHEFLSQNSWAFAFVTGIIAIIITFVCLLRFSRKLPYEEDPKKTDAIQPDDEDKVAGGDIAEDGIVNATENKKNSSPKMKKSDLDAKEVIDNEAIITTQEEKDKKNEENNSDENVEDKDEEKYSSDSYEMEDDMEQIDEIGSATIKQRKRRVRKDEF